MQPASNTLGASPAIAKQHIPALDGVRAIAVLIVICFHVAQAFKYTGHGVFGRLAVWGQTGVDLFFVLSGFLITGILLDSKDSHHFLRNFYVRRILRIFPLYYGTLFAFYILFPLLRMNSWVPWQQSFWFWIYLQNIPATFDPGWLSSGLGHFWSLAVEEHFYLVWPFLVMRFDRPRLLQIAGFAVGLTLLTRLVLMHYGYGTFYFTLARLDALAIGSALAIFTRMQPQGLAPLVIQSKRLLLLLVPAIGGIQLLVSGSHLAGIQIFRNTLIALVYGCLIVLAIENQYGRITGTLLSGRVLGSIGKYSYAMYVFHPFVLSLLFRAGLSRGAAGLAIAILATYLAAWTSWNLFERRFLRLKRYFEYEPDLPGARFASVAAVK